MKIHEVVQARKLNNSGSYGTKQKAMEIFPPSIIPNEIQPPVSFMMGSAPYAGVLKLGLIPAPSRIEAQKFMVDFLGELAIAINGWKAQRLAPIACFAILREETRITSTDRKGTPIITITLLFADGPDGPGFQPDWFDHLVIPPAFIGFNGIELEIVRSPIDIEENYTNRMDELCLGAFCISAVEVNLQSVALTQ